MVQRATFWSPVNFAVRRGVPGTVTDVGKGIALEKDQQELGTCAGVRDVLYLYSCGELDANDRILVDHHLAACPNCQKALREHAVLSRALPKAFLDREPFYFAKNV